VSFVTACCSGSIVCVRSQKKGDEIKVSEDVKPKQLKRRNADLNSRVHKVEEKLNSHQNDSVKVSAEVGPLSLDL